MPISENAECPSLLLTSRLEATQKTMPAQGPLQRGEHRDTEGRSKAPGARSISKRYQNHTKRFRSISQEPLPLAYYSCYHLIFLLHLTPAVSLLQVKQIQDTLEKLTNTFLPMNKNEETASRTVSRAESARNCLCMWLTWLIHSVTSCTGGQTLDSVDRFLMVTCDYTPARTNKPPT